MLTKDHVPPQGLFPARVPSTSVPAVLACSDCNKEWGKNSEYFRDFLLISALSRSTHPDLVEIRQAYSRAQQRRIGLGRSPFLFLTTPLWVPSSTGIATLAHLHAVDVLRVADVVSRIVGVIHRLRQDRLLANQGSGYKMIVRDVLAPGAHYDKAFDLLKRGNKDYACGLLKWCDFIAEEDPQVQEWLISFYDDAIFYVRTLPESDSTSVSFIFGGDKEKL